MRPYPKPGQRDRTAAEGVVEALREMAERRRVMAFTEVCCGRSLPTRKSGDSRFTSAPRIDVVTMSRSWTSPEVVAYEVKVSRSDFKNDSKWERYLPWCNRFYFVSPYGVIRPEDIHQFGGDVGLKVILDPVSGVDRKGPRVKRRMVRTMVECRYRSFDGDRIPWELYHTLLLNKV